MPVNLFSRYRDLPILEVNHATRGVTRSLPVRRFNTSAETAGGQLHRFAGHETIDLLALKYFNREELYWHLLDANGGRLPDDFNPGEILSIPPLSSATRVQVSVL